MTEILFYHLERQPLERVLPTLLEKSLERGWRAVVQAGTAERADALDAILWTYREDSFLPHGTAADGNTDMQPVFLTDGEENPNGAQIRFFVDGATSSEVAPYERAVYLFDGHDEEAVAGARKIWTTLRDAGHEVTYWQQSEHGKWEKKA
ncbi:MAG: DNA polymerase III subunit chi [Hyphomicrobiales bacterium]